MFFLPLFSVFPLYWVLLSLFHGEQKTDPKFASPPYLRPSSGRKLGRNPVRIFRNTTPSENMSIAGVSGQTHMSTSGARYICGCKFVMQYR